MRILEYEYKVYTYWSEELKNFSALSCRTCRALFIKKFVVDKQLHHYNVCNSLNSLMGK